MSGSRSLVVVWLASAACAGASTAPASDLSRIRGELAACQASRVAGEVKLETLSAWLTAMGDTPEQRGEVLTVPRVAAEHPYRVTVQIDGVHHLVNLATSGLMSLADTSGDAGVVALLTNMAALNYDTAEGKLQLNPASGEVVLSIELETDDGLGQQTFTAAMKTLVDQASSLRPKLIGAATKPGL